MNQISTVGERRFRTARTLFFGFSILHIALMNAAYFILTATFEFPEILRKPAGVMLRTYAAELALNQFAYYLFTLSGFSFILLHVFLYGSIRRGPFSEAGKVFAIIAGLLQSLGFGRWVFLVPWIAGLEAGAPASPGGNHLVLLEAFHRYAGLLAGENLAFLAHGIAGIFFSLQMFTDKGSPRYFAYAGIPVHLFIGLYSLEQFGGPFSALGPWNVVFQVLWLHWLLFTAIFLLRGRGGKRVEPGIRDYFIMAAVLVAMMCAALV